MSTACPSNPRKRDRESSPAEQWRNLARTVPATLMHIGTSSSVKAIRSTKNAKSAMKAAKRSGDLSPAGKPDASDILDDAHRRIGRLIATHGEAGHVFVHCASRLGLQGGAPWQAWEGRRADAARYAKDARWRLCRAGSAVEAAGDVLRVVQWRSGSSWPPEAVELLQQARDDVSIGLKALRDTRDAIVVEFFDAWKVLNQNR